MSQLFQRMRWLYFVVGLLLIGVLLALVWKARSVDLAQSDAIVTKLRELKQVDAAWNVEVLRARGEDWTRGPVLDAVTARAVSALRTLIPLTAPLLRSGGELILLKGANAQNEIAAAEKAIRKYKLQHARVEVVGEGVISEPTRVIRATAAG